MRCLRTRTRERDTTKRDSLAEVVSETTAARRTINSSISNQVPIINISNNSSIIRVATTRTVVATTHMPTAETLRPILTIKLTRINKMVMSS